MKKLFALMLAASSVVFADQGTNVASAPTAGADRAFDVATIKPTQRAAGEPGVYRLNGRTFIATGTSLTDLIKFAHNPRI